MGIKIGIGVRGWDRSSTTGIRKKRDELNRGRHYRDWGGSREGIDVRYSMTQIQMYNN